MTKQNTSRLLHHGGPGPFDSDDARPEAITFRTLVITAVNSGDFDGDHNLVAIGNQNGVMFGPAMSGNLAGFMSLANAQAGSPAALRQQAGLGGHHNVGNSILAGANNVPGHGPDGTPLGQSVRSTNGGADPTLIIGSYNGNENVVDIGNGNGFNLIVASSSPASTTAASTPHGDMAGRHHVGDNLPAKLSYQSFQLRVVNVGNDDGNFNSVIIGNQNGVRSGTSAPASASPAVYGTVGSFNGNDNTVNIGNGNGTTIRLTDGGGLLAGAVPPAGVTAAMVNLAPSPALSDDATNTWFRLGGNPLGLGDEFSFFGLDAPHLLKFETVGIDIRDSGNNDGNGNVIAIGNGNGITGYSAAGATGMISGSAHLMIGSYNGNGNLVEIGNGNGINLFLDGGGGIAPVVQPGTSSIGRQVVFQSIGISVANSGNNDGNGNTVAIGNDNGIAGGTTPYTALGSLGGMIGSHDGNGNGVAVGNGNGVNIHLGANSGVVIGQFSGMASGYWLQDGLGDAWFGVTAQEIAHDLTSILLPKLGTSSLASVTFESVYISAINAGNNNGNDNTVAIGNQNGIMGGVAGASGGSFAGSRLNVGNYNGNGNGVAIGNENGLNLYV